MFFFFLFFFWLRKLPEYYFSKKKLYSGSFLNQKKQKSTFCVLLTGLFSQVEDQQVSCIWTAANHLLSLSLCGFLNVINPDQPGAPEKVIKVSVYYYLLYYYFFYYFTRFFYYFAVQSPSYQCQQSTCFKGFPSFICNTFSCNKS